MCTTGFAKGCGGWLFRVTMEWCVCMVRVVMSLAASVVGTKHSCAPGQAIYSQNRDGYKVQVPLA